MRKTAHRKNKKTKHLQLNRSKTHRRRRKSKHSQHRYPILKLGHEIEHTLRKHPALRFGVKMAMRQAL